MIGSAPSSAGRLDRLVDRILDRHRLLAGGDAVLVGVSGGPDSVALLLLLAERAPARGVRLGIAHLNHGLRAEADRDEAFVGSLAAEVRLPLHVRRADVRAYGRRRGLSLEEAGRALRYAFLEEVLAAHGYTKIALGHHADDNAETLLLNLLRGSGPVGLAGIPAVRGDRYIRPLLMAHRTDIEAYLAARGVRAVNDATNTAERFLRNRIRHRLIPQLERDYHPQVSSVLGRTGLILQAEEEWLETVIDPIYAEAVTGTGAGWVGLNAATLGRMPTAAARRVIRRAIRHAKGDLRRIRFDHVEGVLALTQRGAGAGPLYLPGTVRVRRRDETIVVGTGAAGAADRDPALLPDFAYPLTGCGTLSIRETGDLLVLTEVPVAGLPVPWPSDPSQAYMNLDAVGFPLVVRNFRPGDRFAPLGATGTQKLKKYFSDHKVDRAERRRCPLLIGGGRILWVAGHRLDRSAAVTPQTRRVLKVELRVAKW